ncbi:glyoxylate/hydroxypyruvate reductase A [Aliihoeflea aestuarii]|jgi:glyoxylate/hydroxypyruvate reductase|uniref:2-hydroxyacid dehydrogenase n=1 Tax=Aliihoeflea aestuarii TaxID=453840 RepID=UPI0020928FE5|nr:glyoxylate/hydroxypyruvate reductase A [Aliihoeflea aestuarii]MCO6391442.1 glyoxylate/hydroxypyruvate reductase A [Aliihoeflea aestuarii]
MSERKPGRILLSVQGFEPKKWQDLLSAGHEVVLSPGGEADAIDYAVVWKHEHGLLAKLPGLKAIFSIGAGVDHVLSDPDLPDVPVVRVVASNLTQHMVDYVVWRVTDHHRQGIFYRSEQARGNWRDRTQPPSPDVSVGILGLGELGRAAAKALIAIGYDVKGWTRTPRTVDGVETFSGDEGLTPFLNATDILVVLLPHTPATEGIVDYELLSRLRRDNGLGGACLINAGRGKLQKEADILRALDDGTLKEASLDVFETEPLPRLSPLWSHPRVFVTPHAAATSDATHLVPLMLEQMARLERGEPLQNVVDRAAGY